MRLPILALLFASSCLTLEDFHGQNFECQPGGSGQTSGDNNQNCPGGYWCEAKKLLTNGSEFGNVCVPSGVNHCFGTTCPAGQRCSTLDPSQAPKCVACDPCDPLTDSSGGGMGGGGGNPGGGCGSCPSNVSSISLTKATPPGVRSRPTGSDPVRSRWCVSY